MMPVVGSAFEIIEESSLLQQTTNSPYAYADDSGLYFDRSGFQLPVWEQSSLLQSEYLTNQEAQLVKNNGRQRPGVILSDQFLSLSPVSSVDTDVLIGACDRLLDNIDEKLEPLVRVPENQLVTNFHQNRRRQQQPSLVLDTALQTNKKRGSQSSTSGLKNKQTSTPTFHISSSTPFVTSGEEQQEEEEMNSRPSSDDCDSDRAAEVEVEPPSMQEDGDGQSSPAEECQAPPMPLSRQQKQQNRRQVSPRSSKTRHKQTTVKILPLSAVPQPTKSKTSKQKATMPSNKNNSNTTNGSRVVAKPPHSRKNRNAHSDPLRRRHPVVVSVDKAGSNGNYSGTSDVTVSASSPETTNTQQRSHQKKPQNTAQFPNEFLEDHVTYIPLEGNLPVCVYKVQNVESSDSASIGVGDDDDDDNQDEEMLASSSAKPRCPSASSKQRSKGGTIVTKGIPQASLDEWERQQLEKLKHDIEKMTTKYFAGVPLSSTFKDVQLDSDLETVQSSVVNEKFDAAFKAAKQVVGEKTLVRPIDEHFSDDEFIVTAKPPCRTSSRSKLPIMGDRDSPQRTPSGLTFKSHSSRHLNEIARTPSSNRRNLSHEKYVDDIQALRSDIWQLSEQRTKAMNEVTELSAHLTNVLEELHSSQYQVDEYNAQMEVMRREFDDAERKKERLYQELMVLQTEIQSKSSQQRLLGDGQLRGSQMSVSASEDQQQQLEKLVEAQLVKIMAKSDEVHAKERQSLESKIAQLEAEIMRSGADGSGGASSRGSANKVSFAKNSPQLSPGLGKESDGQHLSCINSNSSTSGISEEPGTTVASIDPPTEIEALKQKIEEMQKEVTFLSAKLKEAVLDKEAVIEKRKTLEDKIKRLESERDNLLELFLRNDRLPPEFAEQALELARQFLVQQPPQQQKSDPVVPQLQICQYCSGRPVSRAEIGLSPVPTGSTEKDQVTSGSQQNIDNVIGQLHEQLVETIERKLSSTTAKEETAALLKEKEAELIVLQQKIRQIEEQHERQVNSLVKTIEEEQKERLKLEEAREAADHFEREFIDASRRGEQLAQQVHLLQAQIELDREQTRLAVDEKAMLVEKIREDKAREVDRLRQQYEDEKQYETGSLETQLKKIKADLADVEAERQRDTDLFANGLVNFDRLETSFVNDVNEECRKIANLMDVTPRRVKLMSIRIERAGTNPAAQFNTILTSSSSPIFAALTNLQNTCQELRETYTRQRVELEEKREAIKRIEQEKFDEMEGLRSKLLKEKQEEMTALKDGFLKERRADVEKIREEGRQAASLTAELSRKDAELKEIEGHMAAWKEETIDKLTNKLTIKFVEEMEKHAKNSTKVVRELERRLGDRTRDVERAQREIAFMRQLRNITDTTLAARCMYKDTPPEVFQSKEQLSEAPVVNYGENSSPQFSSPTAVNNLRESLKATAADCCYSQDTATLKRRAARLCEKSGAT